jgi:hypothetical protein
MPARFSGTDDKDETGFRLYGVLGDLRRSPEIRMRVGCYGYFWEVSASWALELPDWLRDCNEDEESAADAYDRAERMELKELESEEDEES